VYDKNVYFASPRGIWHAGYVMMGDLYLIQTQDYKYLILNKLCQHPYFRVFAYQILSENTIEANLQQLKPCQYTWTSLIQIQIAPLK